MLPNFLQRAFARPYRLLLCASIATVLSACGGGGGSPGSVPGAPTPGAKPAAVVLSTSAATIAGSGAAGTEVTLTVNVKDAGNNALSGVTVSFAASSGTVSNTTRVTDANGIVTEKLSVGGDPTARDITITATAGGITSAAKVVTVTQSAAVAPKLLLTASSGTLNSAGVLGVQIRALVIDTSNVVVPGAVVIFATDSGTLSAAQATTNASGVAVVDLNTGADPSNRTITVTGSVSGAPAATVKVNVIGTTIKLVAANTVNSGSVNDITAALTDSAGNPLANQAMTFSTTSNQIAVKGGGPSITDSVGKLTLSFTASAAGTSTITVSALGQTASVAITTVSADFSITPVTVGTFSPPQANTGDCNAVNVRNFISGQAQTVPVTVSSSRGLMYTDAVCTVPVAGAIPMLAGQATVYVKATSPGVATLSATDTATNATVQSTLEFVSPLTAVSVISLQANPSVVGANSAGSTSQQAVLRAVVTDRASQGNPVKNAKVAFTILTDSSGGTLSQPSEVLTGADGSATINYIAGTTTTAAGGVKIQAAVQSAISNATTTANLTVGQRSLFISAGTGNTVLTPNSTTYQVNYTVFVTDAAGHAVPDVTITGSVRPRYYYKGMMVLVSDKWVPQVSASCLNEDVDSDGVLGPLEDINSNGRLDPLIPVTITSSGKTDATGTALISLLYPKDRAYWLDVDFTISGVVGGDQTRYVGYTILPGASADYSNKDVAPPGATSPYGKAVVCTDVN